MVVVIGVRFSQNTRGGEYFLLRSLLVICERFSLVYNLRMLSCAITTIFDDLFGREVHHDEATSLHDWILS